VRARRAIAILASTSLAFGAATVLFSSAPAGADSIGPITFEQPTYNVGTVNGQDGWSSTGAAGSGCAVYDHGIVANSGYPMAPGSFGAQSLRISNAVTSGCFGDQTFSKPTTNAGGEPGATSGPHAPGTLQPTFSASFSFASATGAAQPGLAMSVSPDRGDGARMSYVRIEDNGSYGFNVFFDDYRDKAPFGSSGDIPDGCAGQDDFYETQIAAGLSYTDVHTIQFDMQFVPGSRNDVVKVSIDGDPVITGTSWEDYFRYCEGTDTTRDVQNLLFRTGGTAAPANAGNGFLIDGVSSATAPVAATVPAAPPIVSASPLNHAAVVHWQAPNDGGSPIDGYKVTPVINGVNQPAQTFNTDATKQTLTLTNGVTYRFRVAAHNSVGYGPTTTTASGTTVGAPSAPTKPTVSHPAPGSLQLTFKKPNANGAAITGYTAQCVSNNGSRTKKGSGSPITVSGLTIGQSYTCSVKATNSRGTGPASLRSAAMTA
jgi:hypothetical protein